MPKMKPHSGTGKRVKLTGTGKLRRLKSRRKSGAAFASHPISGSRRLHRRHAGTTDVDKTDAKRIKKLLGR